MRRILVAGNWKMNLDRAGAVALAEAIVAKAGEFNAIDLLVCPPHVYLDAVGTIVRSSRVALGAQNVYSEVNGAYTGETSAAMLVDLGCQYVILGHSERRHILGETDEQVCAKLGAALAAGLTPIVCVGEQLHERQAGQTHEVIRRHMAGSLAGLSAADVGRIAIAYEPVWAIGTGQVATPQQAQEVHLDLRRIVTERYNTAAAERVRILYGGSVKPSNAGELLAEPDIDGALVGGASLKADDFLGIAAAAEPKAR
jgi:triosephosphate isomerase